MLLICYYKSKYNLYAAGLYFHGIYWVCSHSCLLKFFSTNLCVSINLIVALSQQRCFCFVGWSERTQFNIGVHKWNKLDVSNLLTNANVTDFCRLLFIQDGATQKWISLGIWDSSAKGLDDDGSIHLMQPQDVWKHLVT